MTALLVGVAAAYVTIAVLLGIRYRSRRVALEFLVIFGISAAIGIGFVKGLSLLSGVAL